MKKIAVFGKPGSGKSTLSKKLARTTGITLHQLDSIVYEKNGDFVERGVVDAAHQNIVSSESWIIDGLGPMELFYKRLHAADTLIYIDLPYVASYWLVTKRLLKGVTPEGWPKGSSIVKGTLNSYRTLRKCPQFWNHSFRKKLDEVSTGKSLFVISSLSELDNFVETYVRL
ncbi:adenylate kinase [Aliiglaciecola sp. M165]|uniref:adenylate kinase n=1 Tax=Aliiglaciecola sp. M165 TaxID=2593649 RepID=UPI00117E7E37|nr:adenylate kinase [Aliiglaciecola sp. M165]TRY32417.1 adenylate kinase [Aliiglaciecola sp. M165]